MIILIYDKTTTDFRIVFPYDCEELQQQAMTLLIS